MKFTICVCSIAVSGVAAMAGSCDPWVQIGNGNEASRFGHSISANEEHVVVGAYKGGVQESGEVGIFDISTGERLRGLHPSDWDAFDHFGISVSTAYGITVVGAESNRNTWPNGTHRWRTGAAFVFNQEGAQIGKLLASDRHTHEEQFGWSVSNSQDFIVVGAPGKKSVYIYDSQSFNEMRRFSHTSLQNRFGYSVATDGNIVVVGADAENTESGDSAGAVYVYRYDGGEWLQEARVVATDGGLQDRFGSSVAVSGNVIVVGAVGDDDLGSESGSAYIVRYDGKDWVVAQKLLPSESSEGGQFGYSVTIENDQIAIGAPRGAGDTGLVHIFEILSGIEVEVHSVNGGAISDSFGSSVSISDSKLFVGSARSNTAYILETVSQDCLADLNEDCTLDFFDVSGFLLFFQLHDPVADFNGDGMFNFFDVSVFLAAYTNGCP